MATLTLLVLLGVSLYALVASQTPPYNLTVQREDESSRGSGVDLITLCCRNAVSGSFVDPRNVRFWLNRKSADDPDFKLQDYVNIDNGRMGIVFLLREEGYYTCGVRVDNANVRESERVALIAGNTVQLLCPVQPGNLFNYYYGKWTRNGDTIIEVRELTSSNDDTSTTTSTGEILDLDRETFSLTIRSVTRSQASDNYRCVLHNLNPANGNRQQFTQAANLNISLMVNEKPTILEGPEPFIIGLQEASTNQPTFTCVVGGTPSPKPFWSYIPSLDNTRTEILQNREKYDIISNTTREDNGRHVVTITITFLSLTNTDGGIVRCNAEADPDAAYADALLTVLGTADNIDVIVSRQNDIIYELTFPTEIQRPVTLNITYTSEGGATDCRVPSITYSSTRTISYKDDVNQVPFPVYYVSIALVGVNGSQRIIGPPTASEEKIDTTMPDPVTLIAGIFGVVVVVLIAAVVITTAAVLFYCQNQTKVKLKYAKEVFDDPEKYTQHLKNEEEKKEFMRKVLKIHARRLGANRILPDGEEEEDPIDVLAQVLLETAVEKKKEYKEKLIETVTRQLEGSNAEDEEHLKVKDKEFKSLPSRNSAADATKREEELASITTGHHPGRDVSYDIEIRMSPELPRKATTGTRVATTELSKCTSV